MEAAARTQAEDSSAAPGGQHGGSDEAADASAEAQSGAGESAPAVVPTTAISMRPASPRLARAGAIYSLGRSSLAAGARPLKRVLRWTHTPLALRLGTVATAALAIATVAGALVVGVAGIGAQSSHWHYVAGGAIVAGSDSSDTTASNAAKTSTLSIFPRPIPSLGPPVPLAQLPSDLSTSVGSAPSQATVNAMLSDAVLQPRDLNLSFPSEGSYPAGDDPANGLLGSYHEVFQRDSTAASVAYPGLVAIMSEVGLYSDAATASAQLAALDDSGLGAQAGFPGMSAVPLLAGNVGDESRAVQLRGIAAGQNVVIDLVQFRQGAAIGLVGVAVGADIGSSADLADPDLDNQASALAMVQDIHMQNIIGDAQATPAAPAGQP